MVVDEDVDYLCEYDGGEVGCGCGEVEWCWCGEWIVVVLVILVEYEEEGGYGGDGFEWV